MSVDECLAGNARGPSHEPAIAPYRTSSAPNDAPIEGGVDQLWQEVKADVLEPLEAALPNFDAAAAAAVSSKYYSVYTRVYEEVSRPMVDDTTRHVLMIEKHNQVLRDYLDRVTLPALATVGEAFLLRSMAQQWERFSIYNNWMAKFLSYVERTQVQRMNLRPFREQGVVLFVEKVLSNDGSGRLSPVGAAIASIIGSDRVGADMDLADRDTCSTCVSLLQDVAIVDQRPLEELQGRLLAGAREYFAGRAAEYIAQDAVSDYLRKAEQQVLCEERRLHGFKVAGPIASRVVQVAVEELVLKHGDTFLTREVGGCRWLMQQKKHEDLARMFRLLRREPPSDVTGAGPLLMRMGELFQAHVEALGAALQSMREARLAQDRERRDRRRETSDPEFVRELRDLFGEYETMVTRELQAHGHFKSRLEAAFKTIMNMGRMQGEKATLLCSACHDELKRGGDDDLRRALDFLKLVTFVSDKDWFEEHYRSELQKRLLTGKYGEDSEKRMLTQMSMQHGVHFTQKLVRMLSDAKLSHDINRDFAASREYAHAPKGVDLHVTVMALGVWPVPQTYRQFVCQPPPVLQSCLQAFQDWYLGSEIGRGKKCTWIMREGLLTLKATYENGRRYEIQSFPHQLFPLLAFGLDGSTELSLNAMQQRTGILHGNLRIILTELHDRGLIIMDKSQPDDMTLRLNAAFRSDKRVVTIPPKRMEEDRDTAGRGELMRDRTEKLRAIVVRTMKSRKILPYQELIAESGRQCTHFEPDVRLIKGAIESCIEGDYLERLTGDRQGYLQYLP